jgi:hypothetical protein
LLFHVLVSLWAVMVFGILGWLQIFMSRLL